LNWWYPYRTETLGWSKQMRIVLRAAGLLTLVFGIQSSFADASLLPQDQSETGSITGRVLVDGKPATGITVVVLSWKSDAFRAAEEGLKQRSLSAVTDSDGHYKIEGVPFGSYGVAPAAPVLVAVDSAQKQVTVSDTTPVENIDFSLGRGAVITGRITDGDGHPLIGEEVSLSPVDPSKSNAPSMLADRRMYFTDDRGIYRIYGLQPGRYTVSVGADSNPFSAMFNRKPKRVKTYYPGVTESARARPVDLSAGSEASGIDIKLESGDKGFTVRGRVIDSKTGKPISNAMVAYAPTKQDTAAKRKGKDDDDDDESDFGNAGSITSTNANGEFRFDSIPPGKYKADVESLGGLTGGTEFFGDPVSFEVHSDVDKLEIKVNSGASINGVVIVENAESADALEMFPIALMASVTNSQSNSNSMGLGRVAADGSFRIGGLRAGRATISAAPIGLQKYSIVRLEYNGLEQPEGIDIQSNQQLVGLRVIVAPSNCSVRVHITIDGNPGRKPASVVVFAKPVNNETSTVGDAHGVITESGDLIIENLPAGELEISAMATLPNQVNRSGGPPPSAKQTVTVTRGTPAEVSLVINVSGQSR
jgi:protocatechuate 3,4-dioxygenase beta subunit